MRSENPFARSRGANARSWDDVLRGSTTEVYAQSEWSNAQSREANKRHRAAGEVELSRHKPYIRTCEVLCSKTKLVPVLELDY